MRSASEIISITPRVPRVVRARWRRTGCLSAFWYGVATVTAMAGYLDFAGWSITIAQRRMRGLRFQVWLRQTPNLLVLLAVAAGVSLIVGKGPGLYLEAPMLVVAIPVVLFNVWSLLFAPELRPGERDTD